MRWQALVVLAAVAGLATAQPPEKAVQEELKKLEGTWVYESMELGGKKLPVELTGATTLTIKGNTYTAKVFGQVVDEGTFTVDPTKKPKTWDKASKKLKDYKVAGVYELDGDTLRYCEAQPDQERPKDLVSREGTLHNAATCKRKKS